MTNPPRGSLALTGATIYPSPAAEPVRDGVVRIEDGRITAVGHRSAVGIPEALSTIDCSGLAITAGFWNSHVHFFERKWAHAATIPAPELQRQLEEMLTRWGLTSVFDLGSEWKNTQRLRDRIESGEVAGPRILSTGEPLIAAGALPPKIVFDMMGLMSYPMPEITSAEEAPAAARALLDAGVDGIKLHLRAPPSPGTPFPPDAMVTAAREAHDSGRPVFAHPESGADRLESLEGDQRGRHSIRVNEQYRVTFRWEENNAYEVRCEDYHS